MFTKDYRDSRGIMRRVYVPSEFDSPEEGVITSIYLDALYPGVSDAFLSRLVDELWSRGLILPEDFQKPGASEITRAAFMAACRNDALSIIGYASKVIQDRKRENR